MSDELRTTEDYLDYLDYCIKRGETAQAIAFLKHKSARIGLSKIPSPSTVKRKSAKYSGDELCLFEAAAESFLTGKLEPSSVLDTLIKDAFTQKNRRAFEIILKAYDFAQSPKQNYAGTLAVAVIKSTLELLEKDSTVFPTKKEVKCAVINKLGKKLMHKAYDKGESSEWANVFTLAGLKSLPERKPLESKDTK
jgi:hypothetical protein